MRPEMQVPVKEFVRSHMSLISSIVNAQLCSLSLHEVLVH